MDKDEDAVMQFLTDLSRPLRIDLQNEILTLLELYHVGPRRAVEVTVHMGPLDELSLALHSIEFISGDKTIINPILLLWPRSPGRAGNREIHPRQLFDDFAYKRRLAGP